MIRPSEFEQTTPICPWLAGIAPAVTPPESRSQGKPEGFNATAAMEIRGASADLAPAWPPIDRPLPGGRSKSSAQATAGPSPALLVFLEYEQGGGI
jgi:hypothetical protein